jgi:multicomponent Na+:H+ antiporter subunit E
MKWFVYNLLLAFAGVWLIEQLVDLSFDKPLVFLGVYNALFFAIWLSTWYFDRRYFRKLPKLMEFIGFVIKELVVSSLRVAYDVLTPTSHLNPAIIAIPLDAESDREIVTLAVLITLTPGTLSLRVSDDRRTLYVHEMYVDNSDVDGAVRKIKDGYERRVLLLSR